MTSATPWPTSAAAHCTSAASTPARSKRRTRAARGVVEPLREADVLEADGEADAAAHALAARRVARAARQPDRVARQLLRLGRRERRAQRRITSATGSEPVITWPVGSVSPGASAFSSRSSTGIDVERRRELVHLRLVREARPGRRRTRASPRTAGCSCRRTCPRRGRCRRGTGPRRSSRRSRSPPPSSRRTRRRRAGSRARTHDEPPLARGAVLGPDLRRVPVDVAGERLLAVVDHLHGPAGVEREHARAWIWIERSSRPPKAPPTPARWIAHLLRARARGTARSGRGRRAVHCVAT